MITVTIDQAQVNAISNRMESLGKVISSGTILEFIAKEAINKIKLRTLSGIDADGQAFKPYVKWYAIKEGKTTVNLTQSNKMLRSLTQKVFSNNTAKIFFNTYSYPNGMTVQELALLHDQIGVGKNKTVRHFFGISDKEVDELVGIYQEEVEKVKKGLGL